MEGTIGIKNNLLKIHQQVVGTKVLTEIDSLVSKLTTADFTLEHGYAKLGYMLAEVDDKDYWRDGKHESFGAYMKFLSEKYNRGRTQLYNYFSTAKELRGIVTEEELNDMGIAKASELRRAKKTVGQIPAEAIAVAVKPETTVKDLRKLLFDTLHLPKPENGTWFDAGFEFYVTEDQKQTIQDALMAARFTDPVTKTDQPVWRQNLDVLLKLSMEYLAAHANKVPIESSEHHDVGGEG